MNYQALLKRLAEDLPDHGIESIEIYKMVTPSWFWLAVIGFTVIMVLWVLYLVIGPIYSVWASKKRGEASLAEANLVELILVAEATARKNSAQLNREAEVIDAQAVADSVKRIGDALKDNDGYLKWQWIKTLSETDNEIIYVPTETNLPILEANRHGLRYGDIADLVNKE